MGRGLDRVKGFLGGVVALILYFVIGGIVIAFLFRGCEGNHRYMNVGSTVHAASPMAAAGAAATGARGR
ncbi:MAG: hypothetical protein U1E39_04705 [Planctomycetota bacterium]